MGVQIPNDDIPFCELNQSRVGGDYLVINKLKYKLISKYPFYLRRHLKTCIFYKIYKKQNNFMYIK